MHAQTMQDCTYSWMYTYTCTSTWYQMHTLTYTSMDAPTDMPQPPTPSHPSSVLTHTPFPMLSIHLCLVPALVRPRPCHACYVVHPCRTVGPGLRQAQYAPCSCPYTHVLAACQSKMAAHTQHTHVVHVHCASTSHVMSQRSSMCPVFPFRPSWYVGIPSLHGTETDVLCTGHHIYDDPALQPESHRTWPGELDRAGPRCTG